MQKIEILFPISFSVVLHHDNETRESEPLMMKTGASYNVFVTFNETMSKVK
jgi:hypothetical protein